MKKIHRIHVDYDRSDRMDFGGREFVIPKKLKEEIELFFVNTKMLDIEVELDSLQHSEKVSSAYIDFSIEVFQHYRIKLSFIDGKILDIMFIHYVGLEPKVLFHSHNDYCLIFEKINKTILKGDTYDK